MRVPQLLHQHYARAHQSPRPTESLLRQIPNCNNLNFIQVFLLWHYEKFYGDKFPLPSCLKFVTVRRSTFVLASVVTSPPIPH
jgi:hypothetical protein